MLLNWGLFLSFHFFPDVSLFPDEDKNDKQEDGEDSGVDSDEPEGEFLIERADGDRNSGFEVDVDVGVGKGARREREDGVVDDVGVFEVLDFADFEGFGGLVFGGDFVGADDWVVVGEEGTWEEILLISNGIDVAVNITSRYVIEEIKVVAAGAIVVVDIVVNVQIRWNQVCVFFL